MPLGQSASLTVSTAKQSATVFGGLATNSTSSSKKKKEKQAPPPPARWNQTEEAKELARVKRELSSLRKERGMGPKDTFPEDDQQGQDLLKRRNLALEAFQSVKASFRPQGTQEDSKSPQENLEGKEEVPVLSKETEEAPKGLPQRIPKTRR
jgi:hypothetical protein